ncbi:rRNA pseudouridine synthase [Collimonas sp.]|jgi:23S rRNA pseudouridine2604 synthase|uniref:rRNA pseudouridine synthase n=1 Tax=Collimonas sp. TaxID=1963772 RepID=UPI002C2C6822|nr:rRNA pseudouridine synthase [Collimonas sp.]HWX00917.1 rRNA pseudouridine synthase [Collimonas sp.]
MTESIRLAKQLADQLSCSRREAEQYIEGGWVKVDGVLVEEPGQRIGAGQQIELLPEATLEPQDPVTILYHKPAGLNLFAETPVAELAARLVAADKRAADDRAELRFLKRHLNNLNLIEPLETLASGLLIFSQDWRVTRKLVDDAAKIEHEFIVEVSGDIIADGLKLLNHGLSFNRKPLPPIKVSWQNEKRLRFALKAPQRGLLVHMCEQVGLQVVAIKRIRIGRLPMASLAVGEWRYLLGYERF